MAQTILDTFTTGFAEQTEPIDPATFRLVLGNFASGVTVVTVEYEGIYHGSTVASFCSLSLDPALVLVCLDQNATNHALIEQAGRFAVNILGQDSEGLSRHFAGREPDKFARVPFRIGQTGLPLLEDAIATLECRLVSQFPGGDHSIFVGEVLTTSVQPDSKPLLYFRSGYHQLT